MLGAGIRGDGGREARDRRRTEGSGAGDRGERVVEVAVEDVQLLPEGLIDASEDLVVVEDVGHGGLQCVRIESGRKVGRAGRQRNVAVDVLDVGLRHRVNGRYCAAICSAGAIGRVIGRADRHRSRRPCGAGGLVIDAAEVARPFVGVGNEGRSGGILHRPAGLVGEEEECLVLSVINMRNPDRTTKGFAEVVVAKDGAGSEGHDQLVAP